MRVNIKYWTYNIGQLFLFYVTNLRRILKSYQYFLQIILDVFKRPLRYVLVIFKTHPFNPHLVVVFEFPDFEYFIQRVIIRTIMNSLLAHLFRRGDIVFGNVVSYHSLSAHCDELHIHQVLNHKYRR